MSTERPTRSGAPAVRGGLIRLIAGEHRWGWLDVRPSRYGYTRYRLVVCPPGTIATERALLRLWRAWPSVGVFTGFLIALISQAVGLPTVQVPLAAAAGVVVVLLTLSRTTRRQRPLVRARLGGVESGRGARSGFGDLALIERCWDRLVAADEALARRHITTLQHEIVWTQVWNDVARTPAKSPSAARLS